MPQPTVDLSFPIVQGMVVPIDHGHLLLGAIKTALPQLAEMTLGLHPLRGTPLGEGLLHLKPRSLLRIRLAADHIAAALPLAGKELRIGSTLIRLGSPTISMLEPHAELYSRTVVITKTRGKNNPELSAKDREASEAEVLTHIKTRCNADATVRILRWRTIRLHGKAANKAHLHIRGAEIVIEGLDAEHSLAIQTTGIGGRRAFGCGIFVKAGVRKTIVNTATTPTTTSTGTVNDA